MMATPNHSSPPRVAARLVAPAAAGLLSLTTLVGDAHAADQVSTHSMNLVQGQMALANDSNGDYWAFYAGYAPSSDKSVLFYRKYDGQDWGQITPATYEHPWEFTGIQTHTDNNGMVSVAWVGGNYNYYGTTIYCAIIDGRHPPASMKSYTALPATGWTSGYDLDVGDSGLVAMSWETVQRTGYRAGLNTVLSADEGAYAGPTYELGPFPAGHKPEVQVSVRPDASIYAAWYGIEGDIVGQHFGAAADGVLTALGPVEVIERSVASPGALQLGTTLGDQHSFIYTEDSDLFAHMYRRDEWRSQERLEYSSPAVINPQLGFATNGLSLAIYEQDYYGEGPKVYAVEHSAYSWSTGRRLGDTQTHQSQSHVDVADDGSAVVVWREQEFADSTESRIVAMRLSSSGRWLSEMPVASGSVHLPQVAVNSASDFMVSWYDSDRQAMMSSRITD